MSTKVITRYFAFVLVIHTSVGILTMVKEILDGTGTPLHLLAFGVCSGLFVLANRLANQRRWAVVLFTLFCAFGAHELAVISHLLACLYLSHTIAGALVLVFRWRELKPGL